MKALTICQPYADLICLPDDDERAKRVENRTWSTNYRGPLLIHAGKSRQWLSGGNYGIPVSGMTFGAIVGIANLADCVHLRMGTLTVGAMIVNGVEVMKPGTSTVKTVPESAKRRWPWLQHHLHTEGPYCLVLTECRRFKKPIPYRGAQGFFNVPQEVVASQLEG